MNNTPLQIEHELEEMHKKAISNHKKVELLKEQLEKTGAESNRQRHANASARLNETWKKMTTAFQGAGLPPPRAATKEGELLIDILPILALHGFSNAVLPASLASPETSTIDKTLPGSHAWVINHSPAARRAAAARTMRRSLDRSTQLIRAVRAGNEAEVSRLIQWGAPLNSADSDGYTALLTACELGYMSIFKLLLQAGADVNKATYGGNARKTALMIAAENGNLSMCKLLLKKGALINKVNIYGGTALMAATQNRNLSICKLLLENGADINQADQWGMNALGLAIRHSPKILKFFNEWVITHPTAPEVSSVTCIGCSMMGGKRNGSKMNTKRKRRTSSHRRVRKGSYRTKKSTR